MSPRRKYHTYYNVENLQNPRKKIRKNHLVLPPVGCRAGVGAGAGPFLPRFVVMTGCRRPSSPKYPKPHFFNYEQGTNISTLRLFVYIFGEFQQLYFWNNPDNMAELKGQ